MRFAMATDLVRQSARAVGAFAEQADAVGSGCLDGLAGCADIVQHPEVAAALRDYYGDVVPVARALPAEVDSLSVRAVYAATDIESADDQALADMLIPWRTSAHLADTLLRTRLGSGEPQ
jgi:hypothetical protein